MARDVLQMEIYILDNSVMTFSKEKDFCCILQNRNGCLVSLRRKN